MTDEELNYYLRVRNNIWFYIDIATSRKDWESQRILMEKCDLWDFVHELGEFQGWLLKP